MQELYSTQEYNDVFKDSKIESILKIYHTQVILKN
jgi:hypothetical protein